MGSRLLLALSNFSGRLGLSMQTKLVSIFLVTKILPLLLICLVSWRQFVQLGDSLRTIAVTDSAAALNAHATESIERLTTDTARAVAGFLHDRDADILALAAMEPTEENYRAFIGAKRKRLMRPGDWELAPGGASWTRADAPEPGEPGVSTNAENNDMGGFHPRPADAFAYVDAPLYDEIAFIGADGMERVKAVAADSPKKHRPMSRELRDVSRRENTYVKAETYFAELRKLAPGEIFVSDVIGAYTPSNFIGMYTPSAVADAAKARAYPIPYAPEEQAYAGLENPNGKRFEGIVRWATPVTGADGTLSGYVTFALNHDHIMEFVDHITPMPERYTTLPSAYEGNYAFIWDSLCRNIAHPRHHSIVGFDPETGEPQVPWLEKSIYDGWKESGKASWTDFVRDYPAFHEQSRKKAPAPELTRAGLLGLDGRYLNNAPQCTGWMDLTAGGGSGSFYILWSGLYKLTTAAAIPYYTGRYAPSAANGFSRRGFGFVAVGSGLEDFTKPARDTEERLNASIDENLRATILRLCLITLVITALMVLVAVWMARHISRPVKNMATHMAHLAAGDIASVDVPDFARERGDEIGRLARSLHELTLAQRREVAAVNAVAAGDYTRTIPVRSDKDSLTAALNAMIRTSKHTLSQVNHAVRQVGSGANAVSGVSVSLSNGVMTSQEELARIAHAVESVDSQAQRNSLHAMGASELVAGGERAAKRGYEAVTQLIAAMTEIQQAGKKIASVAKLIDDIAFQTNLLALNAAVEASRAGRHGKGFSVVADEVRSLSMRSARAANETSDMVASMLTLMETGARQAEHSDREFQEIVKAAEEMGELFESIAAASNAQSMMMTEIVESLSRIEGVVRDNSEDARRMEGSAGTLLLQAEELREMVSHFRLNREGGD